jgi:hypothetical protein
MFILRLIAVSFLILTFIAVSVEALDLARTGHWHAIAAGQLWTNLHAASLEAAHVFIQRSLDPGLWDAIAWILRQPAWAVAGVPGVILLCLDLLLGRDAASGARRPRFRAG